MNGQAPLHSIQGNSGGPLFHTHNLDGREPLNCPMKMMSLVSFQENEKINTENSRHPNSRTVEEQGSVKYNSMSAYMSGNVLDML